jgi:hypothetical protein
MNDSSAENSYTQQLQKFSTLLQSLQKKRTNLGWIRLAVFAATVLLAYKIFTLYGAAGLLPATTGLGLLLYLVSVDVANNAKIRNTKTLIKINEEELQALNHLYLDREDGGHFTPAEHAYANDLDIFGKASVYQWLSRCYTHQGRQQLANNLLFPSAVDVILARQKL